MERKVIQLAGKTLVVSLPSKWAKSYGVKKGDTLFVEEKGRALLVKTSSSAASEKIHLNLEGPYEFIKRSIDVAYKKGVDELSLSFQDPKTMKIIEKVLCSTMGFEIISQSEKSCIVKSVAKASEEEFSNILRRVFLTLLSIAEESYDAVSKSEFSRLSEIGGSENTINKLTNFCKRILNKNGCKDEKTSNYMYCIVWELERLADEYKKICDYPFPKKSAVGSSTLELYKEANIFVRDFYNLFYSFSQESGIKLTNKRNSLLKRCGSLMAKNNGIDSAILHYITNIINSVYDLAGPYYAMVLK